MDRTEEFALYLVHHVPEAWQAVLHECRAGNVPVGLSDDELTNTFAFARRVLTAAIRRWWSAWHALRAAS